MPLATPTFSASPVAIRAQGTGLPVSPTANPYANAPTVPAGPSTDPYGVGYLPGQGPTNPGGVTSPTGVNYTTAVTNPTTAQPGSAKAVGGFDDTYGMPGGTSAPTSDGGFSATSGGTPPTDQQTAAQQYQQSLSDLIGAQYNQQSGFLNTNYGLANQQNSLSQQLAVGIPQQQLASDQQYATNQYGIQSGGLSNQLTQAATQYGTLNQYLGQQQGSDMKARDTSIAENNALDAVYKQEQDNAIAAAQQSITESGGERDASLAAAQHQYANNQYGLTSATTGSGALGSAGYVQGQQNLQNQLGDQNTSIGDTYTRALNDQLAAQQAAKTTFSKWDTKFNADNQTANNQFNSQVNSLNYQGTSAKNSLDATRQNVGTQQALLTNNYNQMKANAGIQEQQLSTLAQKYGISGQQLNQQLQQAMAGLSNSQAMQLLQLTKQANSDSGTQAAQATAAISQIIQSQ